MSERPLFAGVRYVLADTLPRQLSEDVCGMLMQLKNQLEEHGATPASSVEDRVAFEASVTHLITESHSAYTGWCVPLPDAQSTRDPREPCAVTVRCTLTQPRWVTRSVDLHHIQPEGLYSPDPARFFSGIVISCASLTPHDQEMLAAAVESLGGAVKQTLCEEVTHLVASSRDTAKVRALEERPEIPIEVVAPHWISESFRLNRRLPLRDYEFDLRTPGALPVCLCASWDRPQEGASSPLHSSVDENALVLAGKRVLFARDIHGGALESHPELHSLRDRVEAAGGTCLETVAPDASDEAVHAAVRHAHLVVARFRESPEFGAAMRQNVTVGTLPWLVQTLSKGRILSPRDRLLHFPYPQNAVPGFDRLTITITNYSGAARSYLKELIAKMGGSFTPHMTPSHDVCVALDLVGEKVNKAREWNIPIVNHIWLEQCFATWTNQNLAQSQFITFPGATQLRSVVGRASVPDASLQAWLTASDAPQASHSQATPEPEGEGARPPSVAAERSAGAASDPGNGAEASAPRATSNDTPLAHTPSSPARPVVDESLYVREASPDKSEHQQSEAPKAPEPEHAAADGPEPAGTEVHEPSEPQREEAPEDRSEPAEPDAARADGPPAEPAPEADAAQPVAAPPAEREELPAEPARDESHAEDGREAEASRAEAAAEPAHDASDVPSPAPAASGGSTPDDSRLAEAELGVAAPRTKRKSDQDVPRTPASARKRKREVCLATTSVELKPSTVAVLDALHVRRVDDVSEATHLVAQGLTRTEKMLCAIALGTVQVVSVEWLKEVVRRKALVDAAPYALQDREKEAKWGMQLSAALAHSAAHPGALLRGHTFYLSRAVQPSKEVLKRVIEAAGGHATALSSAAVRAVAQHGAAHHHVIASREDRKQLGALREQAQRQGVELAFWTPELILVGVLRQAMHWDAEYALSL
ncbi:regulator of Ty1 Transposition [Malassezia obtusa]|uniref:Regulator of Ty1 Transposition n=1 Tax=Malassezia obtusa TaxID=76774 RepID=A0AAF0ISL9_9BASI|nr:regulator of Ty1 Transposition [Malassezia obtusa]